MCFPWRRSVSCTLQGDRGYQCRQMDHICPTKLLPGVALQGCGRWGKVFVRVCLCVQVCVSGMHVCMLVCTHTCVGMHTCTEG